MATKKQQAEYRKSQAKSKLAWGIAFFFAIVWLVIALVPFLFMILNSFRKQFDMLSQGVFHLPDPWYFENYSNVVANGFFGYFFRSVIVVAISLVLMVLISAFAAYPLSRMKFRFRNLIYAGVVAMMAIPMHVTLIPIFKMTTNMGLYDTLWSLIGPYVTFALPMSVFIQTAFMSTIPKEIEESALVQVGPVHFGHLQRRVHVERVRLCQHAAANSLQQDAAPGPGPVQGRALLGYPPDFNRAGAVCAAYAHPVHRVPG